MARSVEAAESVLLIGADFRHRIIALNLRNNGVTI